MNDASRRVWRHRHGKQKNTRVLPHLSARVREQKVGSGAPHGFTARTKTHETSQTSPNRTHERSHSTQHWTQTARTAQKCTKSHHSQVQGSAQVDQRRTVSECDLPARIPSGSAEGPPGIRVVRRTCSKQRPLTSETARALCRPSARIWIRDDDSGHSTDPSVISTGNQKRGRKPICTHS